MLDPLLRDGRLPNLERLVERGFSARLRSTLVPISSSAWTGMTTGKHPGQTGVYSFFEPVPGSYDVRLISSASNRATPIWRTLSRRGLSSIIFGVPVTYPPEPILGVMVAGMLAPFDADYTWPGELAGELRERGFVPDLGMWRRDRPSVDEPTLETQLRLKRDVAVELLEREPWSLAWIVFKSLDVLSHQAFDGATDGRVARHYERLDAALGDLVQAAGEGADALVVSDHGFRAYTKVFNLDRWLETSGFATPLPSAQAAAATGPLARARAIEHRRRIESLDLERTRAFATASEGSFGGVRLNLRSREPRGIVDPADRRAVLREISDALRALRTPDGRPLLRRVIPREELYPGPWVGRLPDLLVVADEEWAVSSTRGGPVFASGGGVLADHDREGVWIGAGPGVASESTRGEAEVFDVAPTVLALLGLPVYEDLTGRPWAGGLRGREPVPRVAEAEDPPDIAAFRELRALRLGQAERLETERRLRGLGYVE